MNKSISPLLAAALIVGIAALAPVPAQATDWCTSCGYTLGCYECCKCDCEPAGPLCTGYCALACGSPVETEVDFETMTWMDEGETSCATEEVQSTDEGQSADEAQSADEPAPAPQD